MNKRNAILLIGPTGSGKTPLGEYLESQGLQDRRCVHFDFGENLRRIAADNSSADLANDELNIIVHSLETGELLEDEHFPIARKILLAFMDDRNVGENDLVILNGLPRHAGQAGDLDALLNVRTVVELSCAPEVVFERIHSNAGGDRAGRCDDDMDAIRRKLDIYRLRTSKLLDHYRRRSARIITVEVGVATSADDLLKAMARG